MYYVGETSGPQHVKGVNIHLAKEHARHGDYRRDVDLMEVLGLTDVARVCKPFDVHTHVGPPKMFYQVHAHGVRTAVTYLIMGLCEELEAVSGRYDNFVLSMCILAPKVVSMYEEAQCVTDEATPFGLDDGLGAGCGLKDLDDEVEMDVGGVCFGSVWNEDFVRVDGERSEVKRCD